MIDGNRIVDKEPGPTKQPSDDVMEPTTDDLFTLHLTKQQRKFLWYALWDYKRRVEEVCCKTRYLADPTQNLSTHQSLNKIADEAITACDILLERLNC